VTELVKGLVHVRDALSLIAFLALVLLAAFRTQKVPELVFGLIREKVTRQQFTELCHRVLKLGFAGFLVLALLAALAQLLNHATQPGALTLSDLRSELAKLSAGQDDKIHAEAEFLLGLARMNQHDIEGAIAAFENSARAVHTEAAQKALSALYKQKGDSGKQVAAWEAAVKIARERDDHLALVRLDRGPVESSGQMVEEVNDLVVPHGALQKGGTDFPTAVAIAAGQLYGVDSASRPVGTRLI
jgi:hypothetical protein